MKRQWKDCQIIVLIGIIIFGLIGLSNGSIPNCAYELNGVMYPNTLDCATFWVCEYERPTLVHCDVGLFYDHKLNVCNWWFDVECVETPDEITTETPISTVETTTPVKTTVTEPEITTAPGTETTAIPELETTKVPETTSAPEPETTAAPELETTTAPETTLAPNPETTAAPELETTTVPEITSAPEQETTAHPSTYPDCENVNGQQYYPHITDPSKYYICAGSFPVGLQCPAKFLWHQEYLSCVSTEIPEESCSQDEYTSHPDDEQYYYQCIDSKPILSLCPSNLKWNQDLLKCAGEAAAQPAYPNCNNTNGQIYFPHKTDVTKYYFCAGIFPVELPCPAKFQWYQVHERCIRTDIPQSEEELIDCSTEKYAPHPADDQMYLECVDNKPVISVCPSDLIWSQELLDCFRIPDNIKYPQCNNPIGQIYFPHLTETNKYYICAGDFAIELSCPASFYWYQNYQSCVTTELPEGEEETIDCKSNERQYAPHSFDEQIYYRCIDETPVQMLCPGNLRWNQELFICTDELPAPKYPQCDNQSGQIFFPHLTESNKYYICAGEFAIELQCPTNFFWEQQYQSCVRTKTPEDEEDILECRIENVPQYASYPEDDQLYYHCVEDKPLLMLCPADLKWNQELLICTAELPPLKYPQCNNPSGQIYFPHLTDSSKYYICAGNFPIDLECPSGFEWVQDHQSCATTDITEEELTVIDCSLEGGPLSAPKRGNAQFYYLCVDEKPVLMLCPSDFKWDNMLKKCTDEVTPEPVYPQCLNPDGQIFFPHLTDPSKYYVCAGNFAVELPCPSGFLWSRDYQSCARIETPAEEQLIIDCLSENKPLSVPYKEDDQLYYICIAERPILMLCPSDLKWDQVQKICTDEISIQPQYPQCDNPAGQIYFPHLTDPGKYYICAGSFSIELPCPTSFLWNQDHQSCARTNNPEDEENIIDCLLENGPQSVSHPDNDQLYYLCIAERPVMLLCPSDLKWDQNLETCTETGTLEPVYPQCENSQEDKYFAHLTDSNKYYGCTGTIPYELACPINYVWSQDYQSCKANETPEEEYPLECNRTESREHMSHPSNSQKYFFCMDRRPALLHCPSITNWDDKAAKCLLETEAVSSYPPCGNGPLFYPHLTDPKQYYLCSGYYALIMTCTNDYIWSTVKNTCVQNIPIIEEPDCEKADGKINLPHPTNPKKYYICLGVTPLEMECPGETLWDTTLDTCMVRVYPNCSASDDLTYYPHFENTNQYYECSDKKATLFTCAGDSVWNNKYNSCFIAIDESAPINCIDGKADQTHYYPNDNKKYYICAGEHPYLMECPGHCIWKSSSQQCDMPKMTNLPSIPSAEFPKAVCSTGKEFLTNYQNCHKYYICIGGIMALEFTCEKDTYWDPVNVRCSEEKSNCFLK